MKRNKTIQIIIGFALLAIFSCTNSENQKIQVGIPNELQNNTEVVAYIKAVEKTTNKLNKITSKLIKETGGKDIDNSSDLSAMQMLKLGKLTLQMVQATSEIEEYQAKRPSIDSSLNDRQIVLLDSICTFLEMKMAQIDTKHLKVDTTEMLAQQKIQNEENAEIEEQRAQWEQAQIEQAQIEGREYIPETEKQENSEFVWWHLLFPIGVLALFIFGGISLFKKLKNKVKDIGYAMGEVKSKVSEAKEMTDKEGPNGEKMTKEEKKGLDMLDNLLNKK